MTVDTASLTHAALTAYANATGANLTDIMGALVSLYVTRITNQSEFLLGLAGPSDCGTLSSAQPTSESPYTLPLRIKCNPHSSLADLVELFRTNCMGAQDHYSAQAIALALARTGAQQVAVEQDLCHVTLAVIDHRAAKSTTSDEYPIILSSTSHAVQPDLQVRFSLHSDAMAIVTTYRRDRLSNTLVSSLMRNLIHFLGKELTVDCDPWTVPLVCPAEFEHITRDLAITPADPNLPWNSVSNIVDVVRANAAQYPDVVAIEMPTSSLTYHDLISQMDCITIALHQRGVQPQQRVAVLVSNHSDTVVIFLALWTLGAVYVPVDGQLPSARQQYMTKTAECTLVINAVPSLCNWPGAILFEDLLAEASLHQSLVFPFHHFGADDWAYIIFTSGTTGLPKGVPIRYIGLKNAVCYDHHNIFQKSGSRVLQTLSAGFDASLFFTVATLYHGNTLLLYGIDIIDGLCLASSAPMTPSILACLNPLEYPYLRNIVVGGERIAHELVQSWAPYCNIYSSYGPTEAAMVTHVATLRPDRRVTIGQPIPNAPCYILDTHRNVVPIGVTGEIYVGGPGVSPGYLNHADLNAIKFIANPFGAGTLYATGDLGRWLSNGEIECLGRIDDQVKVRGYHVELSEISNALLATNIVQDAFVLLLQKRLVAFVSPDTIDTVHLLDMLVQHLPHYMVPSHVVTFSSIPLTINGKVDQRALKKAYDEHIVAVRANNTPAATKDTPHTQALQQAVSSVLDLDPSKENLFLSFVQLGGDSIRAIQLASQLRALGYTLPIPLILRQTPLHQLSEAMVPVMLPAAPPIKAYHGQVDIPFPLLNLPPAEIKRLEQELISRSLTADMVQMAYPLLPNLRGMLVATAKRASDYTNQFVISVRGLASIAQLQQAVTQVVGRHEALRSRFLLTWLNEGIGGLQIVLNPSMPIDWTQTNEWTELGVPDESSYLAQSEARGIDVDGAMLRFTAVGTPPGDVRLIMTAHHAILDGWSYGLVIHELLQLLSPPVTQRELTAPVSLGNFIACRTNHETQPDQAYWQTYLQGVGNCTILDLPKPSTAEVASAVHSQVLYANLPRLQALAQQRDLTVHCLLIATWALVLRMYTGQDDIVFGNAVSGRAVDVAHIDRLVGCLVNVVPFRAHITSDQSVLSLLHSIRSDLVAMVAHEHCHLSEIQQWVTLDHPVANLFNTLLVYESFPLDVDFSTHEGVRFHSLDTQGQDDYDCVVAIEPRKSELRLTLAWGACRFDQWYMQHLALHITSCLTNLVDYLALDKVNQQPVSDFSMLCQADRDQLLQFSCGPTIATTHQTVLDMFHAVVERNPHTVAIEHGGTTWTYQQLVNTAQTITTFLWAQGIAHEEPVGVFVQRVPTTVAALLGVLWASAAFVPIDPTLPLDRIVFMIQDCGITHVLYHVEDTGTARAVSQHTQCAAHAIVDVCLSRSLLETTSLDPPMTQPNHLAYILYASRGTGQPKGVMIEHRGLSNLVQYTPSILPHARSSFRHMQALTMTFDACIWDIFTTLCYGGTLVLQGGIAQTLHHVDFALLAPSLMADLDPAQYSNLQAIIAVGERLPSDIALKWIQLCPVINAYGPTEVTIMATVCRYHPNALITIGRPIHNTQVLILDPHRQPVPIGVFGELYIGGPGVMRGYVNRSDLDAKALVPHPFAPGKRLFKTGDLGRWLANGEIECLGCQDDQVKARSMRLQLQEVEAVLQQCPTVTMAAVLVFDNTMYAFVCPAQVEEAMAKTHVSSQLPAHMVPTRIVALDAIPLTVNGKADKRALLEIICQLKQQSAPRSIAPHQTPMQATIRKAMAVALAIDSEAIGIHDSFFTLGGDSLSAIRLTGLCREKGLSITVGQVFDKATAAALAQVCHDKTTMSTQPEPSLSITQPPSPFALLNLTQDALERTRKDVAQQLSVTPAAIVDMVPVSSLQSGFIVNTLKDPSAYMVQQSYRITGALDVDRYFKCWQQVGQRHSIVRTKFVTTDLVSGHTALQVVLATMDMAWSYGESHDPNDADFERDYFAADRQHGFAFDGSPLIRMALFKITDTDHRLFLTFHHALLDAWSTSIVLDEVLAQYHEQPLYPALQYHTYLAHLMHKPAQGTQAFWQTTLNKVKPTPDLQLPSMLPPSPLPSAPSYECYKHSLSCPLADIHAFSQRLGITTNNLLRGLWALLLSRYLNEKVEVTFGVLVSGRNEPLPGIDDMVGLSINTVPFRASFDHQQPLHDWLRGIHQLSGKIMA
ncbi:hypothetical protein H4R35_004494 [Dimargaris xerosporica]|nr:hypothetical protein H4R35_004494 [Dimargaris xerosporica]